MYNPKNCIDKGYEFLITGDWSEYVKCDNQADCQEIYGNTASTQCLPPKLFGVCAPLKCFDNTDCSNVPIPSLDECWHHELFGGCNIEKYCKYYAINSKKLC